MGNCTDSSDVQPASNSNPQQLNPAPQGNTSNTTSNTKPPANNASTVKSNPKLDAELAKHNQYRTKHHAAPLVLSEWLCKGAQAWADYLAKNNKFEHSKCNIDGKGVGENIYWTSGSPNGGDASKAWYDEVKDYKYGSGEGTFSKTGHFSQVVWK